MIQLFLFSLLAVTSFAAQTPRQEKIFNCVANMEGTESFTAQILRVGSTARAEVLDKRSIKTAVLLKEQALPGGGHVLILRAVRASSPTSEVNYDSLEYFEISDEQYGKFRADTRPIGSVKVNVRVNRQPELAPSLARNPIEPATILRIGKKIFAVIQRVDLSGSSIYEMVKFGRSVAEDHVSEDQIYRLEVKTYAHELPILNGHPNRQNIVVLGRAVLDTRTERRLGATGGAKPTTTARFVRWTSQVEPVIRTNLIFHLTDYDFNTPGTD